jgi:hypothetical protein
MLDKAIIDKALAEYVGKKLGRYLKLKQENLKKEYFEEMKKIVDEIGYESLSKKSRENYDKIYGKPGEQVQDTGINEETIDDTINEVLDDENIMDIDIEEYRDLDDLI